MGAASPGLTQAWQDDGNGNVLTATTTTTSPSTTTFAYAPAQANQLISSTTTGKPTIYFGYDDNGDTTAITNGQSLNVGLGYDAQARPITLTSGGLLTATLSYNAAGQRAGYSVVLGSTPYYSAQFSYRGAELGQAVIVSGTQSYTDTYLYDDSGNPLELIRQTKVGSTLSMARYWYEEDGRGNVVALTDLTGSVVDRYSYDAWGNLLSSSESVPQRLRYAGYWYDQELGWYWVGIRYYDPPLGRWLAPDPSQQDGVRTYVYVGDDPVDASDPTGLDGVGLFGNFLDDAITFVVVGAGAVVAIAATPEVVTVLGAAGVVVGASIAVGGIIYTITNVHTGNPAATTSSPRPGDIQSTPVLGGTTLTTPVHIAVPMSHSASNTGPIQLPLGGKIRGYTKHGLDQVISRNDGRGVDPKAMLDAVRNPKKVQPQANGTTRYNGKGATVILNDKGQVVTAWGKPRS